MSGLWSHCLETGQSFPKKQLLDERRWFMELLVLDNSGRGPERVWGTPFGGHNLQKATSSGLLRSTSYLFYSAKSHICWEQSQDILKKKKIIPLFQVGIKSAFKISKESVSIPLSPANLDSWSLSRCQWVCKAWVAQKNSALTVCS